MREIGSEFHAMSAPFGTNVFDITESFAQTRYVQSGRTGLAMIAEELRLSRNVKKIALPAYCCASMVYPFYNKGISVVFYPVPSDFENETDEELTAAFDVVKNSDAVLIMDYFGFIRTFALKLAELAHEKDKPVIVDATQTAFSKSKTYDTADYALISYRKWSDTLCAAVCSRNAFLSNSPSTPYKDYVYTWRTASELKRRYLNHELADKTEFLELYGKANNILSDDYEGYSAADGEIDTLMHIDADYLIHRRRTNAQQLMKRLRDVEEKYAFKLMFNFIADDDCPLFVPILVNSEKRNEIRRYLNSNSIYCPTHWPIDEKYPYSHTAFHDGELSLICDMRYDSEDMERELSVLFDALSE